MNSPKIYEAKLNVIKILTHHILDHGEIENMTNTVNQSDLAGNTEHWTQPQQNAHSFQVLLEHSPGQITC
jgi:hypothetical protein